MKNVLFSGCFRVGIFACVLSSIVLCLVGCTWGTPGETAAEVRRRHIKVIRSDTAQIQDDIDAVFMLDGPSKLSDRYVR